MFDRHLRRLIFEWDVDNWSRALRLWESILPSTASDGATALEVGSRRGGIALYLAHKGYHVVCSDVDNPADVARPIHQAAGVASRIEYTAANVTAMSFADASFDVVAFKSVLGAVGRGGNTQLIAAAIAEMHRVLKPGGVLLFAENLAAGRMQMFLRRRFTSWAADWNYLTPQSMKEHFAAFEVTHFETFGVLANWGRTEFHRRLLHPIDLMLSPLTPKTQHYIGYGYARTGTRESSC